MKTWRDRQNSDPYVIKSRKEGYRSRAAYKLLEINQKDHILKSGMVVIDLGATPGGWSQVASGIVGVKGRVIALDILELEPIQNKFNNIHFIHGDFTSDEIYNQLLSYLASNNLMHKVDVVLSDMAPNLTGIKIADQASSSYLVQSACDFARQVLKPGGSFLAKVFYGKEFENLNKKLRLEFEKLAIRKPDSSRDSSSEVYLLARGYKSYNKE
jgi:23S rRNA (uridine2552-2'-O)-methyltransferase